MIRGSAGTPAPGRDQAAASRVIACYLAAERDLGRIAVNADVDTLAPDL